MEVCATKAWCGWRSGLLELRGYLTEGVLVLARNRNDRIFLSPDDAVPEYNLIPNLLKELGAQSIVGVEKEERKKEFFWSVQHDERPSWMMGRHPSHEPPNVTRKKRAGHAGS